MPRIPPDALFVDPEASQGPRLDGRRPSVGAGRRPSSLGREADTSPPASESRLDSEEALVARYVPLAYSIAAEHFIPGTDRQDVRQEALIGLLNAVRCYDPSKSNGFPGFARLCINRRIWQEIKNARRGKQQPLTNAERDWDMPATVGLDELVEQRARLRAVLGALDTLSEHERSSVARFLNGEPVIGDKALDNGLTRARIKLRAVA